MEVKISLKKGTTITTKGTTFTTKGDKFSTNNFMFPKHQLNNSDLELKQKNLKALVRTKTSANVDINRINMNDISDEQKNNNKNSISNDLSMKIIPLITKQLFDIGN